MPHIIPPNYRQQRALDAIDHAAIDFGIVIEAYAPDTATVRQAQGSLAGVVETVKTAIMSEEA